MPASLRSRHVLGVEQDWGKKVGLRPPPGEEIVIDAVELGEWRSAYCSALRTFHADGRSARNWPLRYLIRHTAYHSMDHTWEMEDKDLSASTG